MESEQVLIHQGHGDRCAFALWQLDIESIHDTFSHLSVRLSTSLLRSEVISWMGEETSSSEVQLPKIESALII